MCTQCTHKHVSRASVTNMGKHTHVCLNNYQCEDLGEGWMKQGPFVTRLTAAIHSPALCVLTQLHLPANLPL